MKKFESAHLEFIYFDVSDVVCTSGGGLTNGGNEGEGGSGSIDELFGPLDNLNLN